jgi:pyridinium-3,5-biscarboxylic acid mononucleotide sulfurtransferase
MPNRKMKDDQLIKKHKYLEDILQGLDRVAVAFSGGVDSTFLLYTAADTLSADRVTALFADSRLVPSPARENAFRIFERYFKDRVELKKVEIDPLGWQGFSSNPADRCYLCKKKIYSIFLVEMQKAGVATLIDGTNMDDLAQDRPGFRAIQELGVITPLAQAGLTKADIRRLAHRAGLDNYDLPSNSCLATRIETATPLSVEILQLVDKAERFLMEKGFPGSRVRPLGKRTVIEVGRNDLDKLVLQNNRLDICHYFKSLGLEHPVLDLEGRQEALPERYKRAKKKNINS